MRVRIEMDGSALGTKVYNAANGQEVYVAALALMQDFRERPREPLATLVITGAGPAPETWPGPGPELRLAEVAGLEADVEVDGPTARAAFKAIQATPQTALEALEDLAGVVRGLIADGAVMGMFARPGGQEYRERIEQVLNRALTAKSTAEAAIEHARTVQAIAVHGRGRAEAFARAGAVPVKITINEGPLDEQVAAGFARAAVAFDGGQPVTIPPGIYTAEQLAAKVEELGQLARSIVPAVAPAVDEEASQDATDEGPRQKHKPDCPRRMNPLCSCWC